MSDTSEYKKSSRNKHRHIFFPVMLVAIGIFLLLNNMGYVEGSFWDMLIRLWPILFIIGGLDTLINRGGYVGAVLGTGIGVIFLLSNFGFLYVDFWNIVRFWPVLLIAWGLDIVVGQRSFLSLLLGIILGLALITGVVWLSENQLVIGQSPAVEVEEIHHKVQDAEEAAIFINPVIGYLEINAATEPSILIDGQLQQESTSSIQKSFRSQNEKATFRLEQEGQFTWLPTTQQAWQLDLNTGIPIDLETNLAAGEQNLDLEDLEISDLSSEMAVGKTVVTLPRDSSFQGDISVAVGELVILIPENTNVRIVADTGLTGVTISGNLSKRDQIITTQGASDQKNVIRLNVEQSIGLLRVQTTE